MEQLALEVAKRRKSTVRDVWRRRQWLTSVFCYIKKMGASTFKVPAEINKSSFGYLSPRFYPFAPCGWFKSG